MKKEKNKKWGFTLIEMIVVVGIIGILSTLLLVSVGGIRKNAVDTRRKSNLENVRGAATMYYSVKSSWPDVSGGWAGLIQVLSNQGYLTESVLTDEDGDGVADYTVTACESGCQMKLCATCVVPTGEGCVDGKYCLDVK